MKLDSLTLTNFKSFGPDSETIKFDETKTSIIGPNGSGKTAILEALSRMFSANHYQRRLKPQDFHVPSDEESAPDERALTLDALFTLPEAKEDGSTQTIPVCFNQMRLSDTGDELMIKFRLEATMGPQGDIDESLFYIVGKNKDGDLIKHRVPRNERNNIAVYYLPARRDPEEHVKNGTNALIGRILRSIDWSEEYEIFQLRAKELQNCLAENQHVKTTNESISSIWENLHKGKYFNKANLSFGIDDINRIQDKVSLDFTPAHHSKNIGHQLLSDGQKSLLYISLVTSFIKICKSTLNSEEGFDLNSATLKPPVFSIIAIEEPENSLSPHYLGSINSLLKNVSNGNDCQSILTTHSPSLLKRVLPSSIRYVILDSSRLSSIQEISMPPKKEMDKYKYIQEGLLSNPEIYFSKFVVLGEGASEDIVLPKMFEAFGLPLDENGITLAQLGGRHVNYMWKILDDLKIPHATLLDLDLCRHNGGWGRVKYAGQELKKINKCTHDYSTLPKWDESNLLDHPKWLAYLQTHAVFYSKPLDLDFSLITHYPEAYGISPNELMPPEEATLLSVLGKGRVNVEWYSDDQKTYFDVYHRLFKLGSKPANHLEALSNLTHQQIVSNLPVDYKNLIEHVKSIIEEDTE